LLIQSFNGKPQASLPFACACGSPLNENAQYTTKSTPRKPADPGQISLMASSKNAILRQIGLQIGRFL
jgi:hypothetical protein